MSNRITEKLLFSPTNIPGCQLWLDGADPNGNGVIPANGATVSTWADKSRLGNNGTSGGAAVTYSSAGLYFGGSSYYSVPGIAGTIVNTPFVIFIVETLGSTTPSFYFGDDNVNDGGAYGYSLHTGYRNDTNQTFAMYGSDLEDTTVSGTGNNRIWALYLPIASNRNTRRNGTVDVTFSNYNRLLAFTAPVVGRVFGGNYYVGTISEVIVYNIDIGLGAVEQVEGYLAWKWGLVANLPSNHPYKNLAPSYPLNAVITTTQGAFSPTSISGLTAWFDGSDPAGTGVPPSDGDPITTWVDKSGQGHDAVAGGAPTFAAASLNGLGTISFDGATNYLYASGLTVPTDTHSLFAVHNPVVLYNPSGSACLTGILRAQENVGYIVFPYGGGLDPGYGYTTSYISGYFGFGFENDVAGSWNLYETVVGSSAVTQYQYGTVVTADTGLSITATTSDNFTVGSYSYYGGDAQQFYWGSMAELLVFNVELSTSDRQKIEGYLAWKWGLEASLDPSNPYYSAPPTSDTTTSVNVPWILYCITTTAPYSSISNRISVKSFSPLNITGLQLWLDAADPNANGLLPANGATLSTWVDKSGNARNATVAAGKIAGTYSTSNKAVNFAASNTGYATSYTANPSTETMFVVFNNPSPSGTNNMVIGGQKGARSLSGGYAGGGAGVGACSYLNNQVAWSGMASMPAGTYTSGTTVIITGQVNGATTNISQNGGTIYSNTTVYPFYAGTTTYLGTDYHNASFYYIGYEMEVIFYNSLLTLAQRQTVEGYLAWKWSLQSSLPSNHPFKNSPPPP